MREYQRHIRPFFRFLLPAIYFFLFAIQFAGKVYTIANFFDYSSRNLHHAAVAIPTQSERSAEDSLLVFVENISLPDGLHLSLDKRYNSRHIQPVAEFPTFFGSIQPAAGEERRLFYRASTTCVSHNVLTPFLRGPPCIG